MEFSPVHLLDLLIGFSAIADNQAGVTTGLKYVLGGTQGKEVSESCVL
jgi:hypothetical protein